VGPCHQSMAASSRHACGWAEYHAAVKGSARPTSSPRAASAVTAARLPAEGATRGDGAGGAAGERGSAVTRAACCTAGSCRAAAPGGTGFAGMFSSRPGRAERAMFKRFVASGPGCADPAAGAAGVGAAARGGVRTSGAAGRGAAGDPSGTARISPRASIRAARRGSTGSLRPRMMPTRSGGACAATTPGATARRIVATPASRRGQVCRGRGGGDMDSPRGGRWCLVDRLRRDSLRRVPTSRRFYARSAAGSPARHWPTAAVAAWTRFPAADYHVGNTSRSTPGCR
jgi:hypothetical protein